jgi:hypothetical protein
MLVSLKDGREDLLKLQAYGLEDIPQALPSIDHIRSIFQGITPDSIKLLREAVAIPLEVGQQYLGLGGWGALQGKFTGTRHQLVNVPKVQLRFANVLLGQVSDAHHVLGQLFVMVDIEGYPVCAWHAPKLISIDSENASGLST